MQQRPLSEIEEELRFGALALDEAVAELCDASRADDLCRLAAARLRFEADVLARLLLQAQDAEAALVCRALGLTLNGFSAVLRMRHRQSKSVGADPIPAMTNYQRLERLTPAALAARLGLQEPAG